MNPCLKLFDIPFYICNEERLFQESCDYLEEPVLYTIVFVASDQCGTFSEAGELLEREHILWLPGDTTLRSVFPKKERHTMAEFSIRRYVMQICQYAVDMGLDICLLMDNVKHLNSAIEEIRSAYPYLAIHGMHLEDMGSYETVVNEINSIAPEILILGTHTGDLRQFLENERHKTNARLCICVGELLIEEMSKKKKLFHTITMSRRLKKRLSKYSKKEQDRNERN